MMLMLRGERRIGRGAKLLIRWFSRRDDAMREERAIEVTRKFLKENERFAKVSELTGAKMASDTLRVRMDLIKGTYPYSSKLKSELQDCLKDELDYDNVDVVLSRVASPSNANDSSSPKSVKRVGSVVAVSSCKGGVGKSTVAVNLAYSMSKYGARVGILDLDVYGPSLPTLVNVPKTSLPLRRDPITKLLEPPTIEGVKLMSYGLIAKGSSEGKSESAVVRGPIASRVVQQMISGTDWGALDVLILDLPPGTGDIVLTTCQTLNITAAIVVTTPQQLSYVDVVKGIDMFRTLNVPVVSVVENMAHFDVRGERFYPFGRGIRDKLERHDEKLRDAESFTLPIQENLSTSLGTPVVIGNDKDSDDVKTVFTNMAQHLGDWISCLQEDKQQNYSSDENHDKIENQRLTIRDDMGNTSIVSIGYDSQRVSVVLRFLQGPKEGTEFAVKCKDLRLASRDAKTSSETTKSTSVSDSIRPVSIEPVGNYAVSIHWSDGHSDGIYPIEQIESVATSSSSSSS